MLQRDQCTTFTVSELFEDNQQDGWGKFISPIQIRVKMDLLIFIDLLLF